MAAATQQLTRTDSQKTATSSIITSRAHARVGLLGNPSDGYFGKTISFSLQNFYAEVTLTPGGEGITMVPHPEHDATSFASLEALVQRVTTRGYYGGVRLLLAMCKRFSEAAAAQGVSLPPRPGFRLSYTTTIPRQAGLSGSSAILAAALSCLLQYYGVEGDFPVARRPQLLLSAEAELGITAGLQDRVIQVYGGLVYMDFDRQVMELTGGGRYTSLDPALLPRLWLIWCDNPSDSGAVHSSVKQRWMAGDPAVVADMAAVADCAEQGRQALLAGDTGRFAALMDTNFDLRRRMFGDGVLGATNLDMIAAARSVGAAAKFTGSGGAILAFCPGGAAQEAALLEVCSREKFEIVLTSVAPALHQATGQ